MRYIRLYLHFLEIHVESIMQHKMSFFLTATGQFLISFHVFLGVFFMMDRFHQVNGFTYPQVLLCFAISLSAFTLAETCFRGFDTFASMIGNGEFDRVLLRPMGPVYQVLCSKIELTRVGRLLQSIIMLAYALPRCQVVWTGERILTVIAMIAGGTAVFAAIFILYASLCFFTLEGLEFMNIFTDGAREYGKYPVGIYGKTVLTICTYLIPFSLFQYYPFLYLIGKSGNRWYALLPFAAFLFLIPCLMFWNFGLSRYQSTGS